MDEFILAPLNRHVNNTLPNESIIQCPPLAQQDLHLSGSFQPAVLILHDLLLKFIQKSDSKIQSTLFTSIVFTSTSFQLIFWFDLIWLIKSIELGYWSWLFYIWKRWIIRPVVEINRVHRSSLSHVYHWIHHNLETFKVNVNFKFIKDSTFDIRRIYTIFKVYN